MNGSFAVSKADPGQVVPGNVQLSNRPAWVLGVPAAPARAPGEPAVPGAGAGRPVQELQIVDEDGRRLEVIRERRCTRNAHLASAAIDAGAFIGMTAIARSNGAHSSSSIASIALPFALGTLEAALRAWQSHQIAAQIAAPVAEGYPAAAEPQGCVERVAHQAAADASQRTRALMLLGVLFGVVSIVVAAAGHEPHQELELFLIASALTLGSAASAQLLRNMCR